MTEDVEPLRAFGARLRAIRHKRELSQLELAELGGVTEQSQLKYEKAKTAPTVAYLMKLGRQGFDVGYLLTGIRSEGAQDPSERLLIDRFHRLSVREKDALLHIAALLAGDIAR